MITNVKLMYIHACGYFVNNGSYYISYGMPPPCYINVIVLIFLEFLKISPLKVIYNKSVISPDSATCD